MKSVKTPTKTQQAIDFLELIHKPNSHDIIAVSKKVNCTERLVWRAFRRLRDRSKKISEEFSIVNELTSDLIFLKSFMKSKMMIKAPVGPGDKERLNQISERLEVFRADIGFQEYMRLKEEMESVESL